MAEKPNKRFKIPENTYGERRANTLNDYIQEVPASYKKPKPGQDSPRDNEFVIPHNYLEIPGSRSIFGIGTVKYIDIDRMVLDIPENGIALSEELLSQLKNMFPNENWYIPQFAQFIQNYKDEALLNPYPTSPNPPTKDGSGGAGGAGSAGGAGGAGGGETPEQKKAREEAEKKAKEAAAAAAAKKAEETLEIAKKLKSAPDSDQCKISRLYTPLQNYYFQNTKQSNQTIFKNSDVLYCEKEGELAQEQNLTKNSYSDMEMFYLENHKYSAFVPTVELYKVVREKKEGSPIGEIVDIKHIAFPTTGLVTDSLVSSGDQDAQFEKDNIGIKSVSWHFDGTDRFTADKYVSAEVVLITENFDSLFRDRTSTGFATGPLREAATTGVGGTYRISDLLFRPGCLDVPLASRTPTQQGQSATQYSSDFTNEYKPECFEILLTAGYDISDIAANNLGIDKKAAKKLKTSMFLTLLDHQFDFKENGSVEVRIRYRGRLEAMLRSPAADTTIGEGNLFASDDILKKLSEISKIEGLDDELKKRLAKYDPTATSGQPTQQRDPINYSTLRGEITDITRGIGTPPDNTDVKTSAKKEAIAKLNQIDVLMDKEITLGFFASVTKELFDNDKVYTFSFDNTVGVMANYLDEPTEANLKTLVDFYNQQVNEANALRDTGLGIGLATDLKVAEVPPTTPSPAPAADTTSSSSTQESVEPNADSPATEQEEPPSTPKDISFVFLGDLIDAIITIIKGYKIGNKDNARVFENIKIVLSNVKLPDFTNNRDGGLTIHSIAALPVAYTTLNSFANSKTSIGKKSYTFLNLLRDLLNFVLPEALGTQCTQNQYMPSVRSNLYSYTSFSKVTGLNATTSTNVEAGPLSAGNTAGGVSLKTILPRFKDEYDYEDYVRGRSFDVTELLLVYVENTDYKSNSIGFDLEADKSAGVPWYIFGYDRGIFKKAQLTKMDQPYVLEARYRENKGAYLNQFSNMYKATIEMAGNNLLIVGSYVWLDFSGISNNLGDPKNAGSLSYYMGLGGLYLIIDIKSNMTPGRFTTTLEARFVSRGIGRQNAGSNQDSSSSANAVTTTTVIPAPAPAVPSAAAAAAVAVPPVPTSDTNGESDTRLDDILNNIGTDTGVTDTRDTEMAEKAAQVQKTREQAAASASEDDDGLLNLPSDTTTNPNREKDPFAENYDD